MPSGAIFSRKLCALKWLNENSCPWNGDAFGAAAECGHLYMMKWLKVKGFPWDVQVGRRLKTMKYLRSEWTSASAIRHSIFDSMLWLKQNDCPWDWRVRGAVHGWQT